MKMNMMMGHGFMAGAVAINGGVGVMEIRRSQVNSFEYNNFLGKVLVSK